MIQAQDAESYNTIKEIDKMGRQSSDKYWIIFPVHREITRAKGRLKVMRVQRRVAFDGDNEN